MSSKPKSTIEECPHCGRFTPKRDLVTVEGQVFCSACVDGNTLTTYNGGQCLRRNATRIHYRMTHGAWTVGFMSRLDLTNEHRSCPNCNRQHLPGLEFQTVQTRNRAYQGIFDTEHSPIITVEACPICAGNNFECTNCGRTYLSDAMSSYDVCLQCNHDLAHDENDSSRDITCPSRWTVHVREYHAFDPVREFGIQLDSNTIYYGTELEHEWNNIRTRGQVRQLGKKIHQYFKDQGIPVLLSQDGSINNGAELVSIPMSLEAHLKVYKDYWETVPELRAENHTGLHVHVSKSPLSRLLQGRIVHFVNAKDNRSFMVQLARRESGEWARYDSSKVFDEALYDDSRYSAVNVGRSATLEFRLFKSAGNFEEYAVSLEFVDALIEFCRVHDFSDLHYEEFIKFVAEVHEFYPHLANWCQVNFPGVYSVEVLHF